MFCTFICETVLGMHSFANVCRDTFIYAIFVDMHVFARVLQWYIYLSDACGDTFICKLVWYILPDFCLKKMHICRRDMFIVHTYSFEILCIKNVYINNLRLKPTKLRMINGGRAKQATWWQAKSGIRILKGSSSPDLSRRSCLRQSWESILVSLLWLRLYFSWTQMKPANSL